MKIPAKKNQQFDRTLPEWVWETMIVVIVAIGVVYSTLGTTNLPIA